MINIFVIFRSFISNKNSILAKTKTEYKDLYKQPVKKAVVPMINNFY